jgi:hypothetical protein
VFGIFLPFVFRCSVIRPFVIRPFVFRPFVIRTFVFRPSVIRPFVIRPPVFRPYVGESNRQWAVGQRPGAIDWGSRLVAIHPLPSIDLTSSLPRQCDGLLAICLSVEQLSVRYRTVLRTAADPLKTLKISKSLKEISWPTVFMCTPSFYLLPVGWLWLSSLYCTYPVVVPPPGPELSLVFILRPAVWWGGSSGPSPAVEACLYLQSPRYTAVHRYSAPSWLGCVPHTSRYNLSSCHNGKRVYHEWRLRPVARAAQVAAPAVLGYPAKQVGATLQPLSAYWVFMFCFAVRILTVFDLWMRFRFRMRIKLRKN